MVGTFKFYAIDKTKSTEHPVTMQVFDKSGKLLDTKTVTIQK
ncbi:immunoglobulin-like domain-containing protein [Listeria newyorkensis]